MILIMLVQEYLKEFGLQKLQDELKVTVREYPDRIVLNYDQIESKKNHPVVDECRALILRKDTWEVMARSFDRFYNCGELKSNSDFPISQARVEEKVDGSIMSVYWDGNKWCVSTRSMADAEGTIPLGLTFRQVFDKATPPELWKVLNASEITRHHTWVFELTSPETRVVTPYSTASLTFIGARNNLNEQEMTGKELDVFAKMFRIRRPRSYKFTTLEETVAFVKTLNSMDEGFVLTYENGSSFWRLKCKNEKYLAIAHMRENGDLSPHRILRLIVSNEQAEYLSYFPEDKKYFDFVDEKWQESLTRIQTIYSQFKDVTTQKDFALGIMPLCKYDFEKGMIFDMRKGKTIQEVINKIDQHGCKRITKGMNLRSEFSKKFGVQVDEEEA